jgi:hypothetical protein
MHLLSQTLQFPFRALSTVLYSFNQARFSKFYITRRGKQRQNAVREGKAYGPEVERESH